MFFTAVCFSKASRRALTPKRGNKDFYKGAFNDSYCGNVFIFDLWTTFLLLVFVYSINVHLSLYLFH